VFGAILGTAGKNLFAVPLVVVAVFDLPALVTGGTASILAVRLWSEGA